jgi:hypothetical protein
MIWSLVNLFMKIGERQFFFNENFSSFFVNPATRVQHNYMAVAPLLQNRLQFDDSDIVPEQVEKIIQNLSIDKAPCIDGVLNVVVRELASCLSSPLATLLTFV